MRFILSRRERTLAGVLFPFPVADPEEWRRDVLSALSLTSFVAKLLPCEPDSVSSPNLLKQLRKALNPNNWDAEFWAAQIATAESWLKVEHHVAPGAPPKGMRPETIEKVSQIISLRMQGRDVASISLELNISAANVYQLLHRYFRVLPK